MIPVDRDEILSCCSGIPVVLYKFHKFFINYILRLHVKRFIPTRRDPFFELRGRHFPM